MAMKKFKMLNLICDNCALSSKEKLVAQYFIYKSNKSGECYPSVETISKHCGVSVRTVQRATKKLQERNYISIDKRYYKGRQSSNQYTLNTDIEIENNKEHLIEESNQIDFEFVSMSDILCDDLSIYNPFEEETEALDQTVALIEKTIIETEQKTEELSTEIASRSSIIIKDKVVCNRKPFNNICLVIKIHSIYVLNTAVISFDEILQVQVHYYYFYYENIKYMVELKVSKLKNLRVLLHIHLYVFFVPILGVSP